MMARKETLVPLVTKCPTCGEVEEVYLLVETGWKPESIEPSRLFHNCKNNHRYNLDRTNVYADLSGAVRSVGQKIRSARLAKKLGVTDLASKAHISAGELNKYESGQQKPREVVLEEIAHALGVPVDSLRP